MTQQLGQFSTTIARTHVGFQFSTHDAAGANVAPSSAFEAADLRIYRSTAGAAFSATQRSSANGITMTSPFDSLTGLHDVNIDLTDNTDSGFYASGYRYTVVLSPDETVDSQTITGIVLASFEIVGPRAIWKLVGGEFNGHGGRVFHVSTSGNDSNLGTFDSPKLTGQGAVDAASTGDDIQFGEGLFTGQVTIPPTKKNLHLHGAGWSSVWNEGTEEFDETGTRLKFDTDIQYDWVVFLTSGCTISDCHVEATGANKGTAVSAHDVANASTATKANDVTIERCKCIGYWDAIYVPFVRGFKLIDCYATGTYDSVNCTGGGGVIKRCYLFTSGIHTSSGTPARAVVWGPATAAMPLRIEDSDLIVARTTNTSHQSACVFLCDLSATVKQSLYLENVRLSCTSTHASATGSVYGVYTEQPSPPTFPTVNAVVIEAHACSFTTSAVGSGTVKDIRVDGDAASVATLYNCIVDVAKCQGTVRIVDANVASVYAKIPSKSYLAGSNNSDGDVEMNEATGNFGGSVASVVGAVGSVTGAVGGVTSAVTVGTINAGVITATAIADGAMSAAKFAAGALDSVWSVGSRLLTAGTNIVLAKGTGVTGFNDLSAAAINAEVDTALAEYDAPTNAEMTARTLASASYATSSALATAQSSLTAIADDVSSDLPDQINAVSEAVATVADQTNQLVFVDGKVNAIAEATLSEDNIEDIADAVADQVGSGGGASTRPVNQVPVPMSRTWILKPVEGEGLVGEVPLTITTSDTGKLYAVEYRNDVVNNGRLLRIISVELISGSEDGIALGDDIEDVDFYGVDRSQAKFKITPITAGKYVFGVTAEYDGAEGGGESYGEVTLIVV
jgi:hypothetical protein